MATKKTSPADDQGRLAQLDLTLSIEKKKHYRKRLKKVQLELLGMQQTLRERKIPVVLVMQGVDAAGKGGAIKRTIDALDPRGYRVVGIGAPTTLELDHHYLWRFWLELPARGQLVIYDRSWYGRVLVERVEGFATKEEWGRAYDEINAFEKMLVDDGHVMAKFWLQISKKEQLKRFRAREKDPFKQWKLTDEDWRNRRKWDPYLAAAEEMFTRTSTPHAPWTLVEAEDKRYARVKVAETVAAAMKQALK